MTVPVPNLVVPTVRSWNRLSAPIAKSVVESVPAIWWDYELTSDGTNRYPTLDNDIEGDCVIAWELHYIESQWRRLVATKKVTSAPDIIATADQANSAYWAEVSRQAGSPQPSNPPGPGLDPVQAVIDWHTYGLECASETNFAHSAFTFLSKEPSVLRAIAYSCAGIGLMLELPSNYNALAADVNTVWTPGLSPDPSLGHMAFLAGYSGNLVAIKSWGQSYRATWDWVATYCVGMIAVINSDWDKYMLPSFVHQVENQMLKAGTTQVF